MRGKLTLWVVRIGVHAFATLCVAVVLGFFSLGKAGAASIGAALADPAYQPDWWAISLTVGLAACFWALIVIAVAWGRERKQRPAKTVLKTARGTILTEFLIILVPFLALTSGLAQLAILEISTLLGHVAAYEGARAAWVWYPETTRPGNSTPVGEVQNRARIAAAIVMAPTAPANFNMTPTFNPAAMRTRGFMRAHFTPGPATGSANFTLPVDSRVAQNEPLRYYLAYDESTFQDRAAQKFNFAYQAMNLRLIPGGPYPGSGGRAGEPPPGTEVGVDFEYRQNVVFPWFAWIWGDSMTIAGRTGYYAPIRRRYTLEAQVRMD